MAGVKPTASIIELLSLV